MASLFEGTPEFQDAMKPSNFHRGEEDRQQGFFESVELEFEVGRKRFVQHVRDGNIRDKYKAQFEKLKELGVKLPENNVLERQPMAGVQAKFYRYQLEQNSEVIKKAKADGIDIKTSEELQEEIRKEQEDLLERERSNDKNQNFAGLIGSITGQFGAALTDPVNLMLMPLGGVLGAGGKTVAATIGRTMMAEMALQTGAEVIQKPSEVEFRRQYGEPDLTTKQALLESAASVGMTGAFTGVTAGFSHVLAKTILKLNEKGKIKGKLGQAAVNMAEEFDRVADQKIDPSITVDQHIKGYVDHSRDIIENDLPIGGELAIRSGKDMDLMSDEAIEDAVIQEVFGAPEQVEKKIEFTPEKAKKIKQFTDEAGIERIRKFFQEEKQLDLLETCLLGVADVPF